MKGMRGEWLLAAEGENCEVGSPLRRQRKEGEKKGGGKGGTGEGQRGAKVRGTPANQFGRSRVGIRTNGPRRSGKHVRYDLQSRCFAEVGEG